MTISTATKYNLTWEAYGSEMPELGGIYSDYVHFYAIGDYKFEVSFRVGDHLTLGILFVVVNTTNPDGDSSKLHYSLGQFHTNTGAMKFAQFALDHFIETETWSVCPSFQPVDYIDGDPYTLSGDEIVSELV